MGNCFGCCDDQNKEEPTRGQNNVNTSLKGSSNPSEYQSASREAMAAAAERRAAEQRAKSQPKNLKRANAELPENTGSGLRWQVG